MKVERGHKLELTYSDEKELIEDLYTKAKLQQKEFALWNSPESDIKYLCIGLNQQIHKEFDLENDKGFVVSPFVNKNHRYYLIPPDLFVTISNKKIKIDGTASENDIDEFLSNDTPLSTGNEYAELPDTTKEQYIKIVTKAITRIKQDKLKKVVVARLKNSKITSVNPVELFSQLIQAYPNAFVSLVYIPGEGAWIGASPELLMAVEKNNTLKTIALAATQNVLPEQSTPEVVWKEKEIEEQALVNRYITNCLKKLDIKNYEETGPRTVRSGHLMHLRTDFSIRLTEASQLVKTSLLKLLHPTSAICGMPKEEATDFITQNENFNRELYAGFLGPVNIEQETKLFVNIRCARLFNNTAILYAGAGITADSDPVKEWDETESKLQTLGTFLFKP